jgi:DTW domain-containing protein YfiP
VRPCFPEVRFALLVHPREARNPVGTGRMLHLGLGNSFWIEGHDFHDHPQVLELIADPANFCAILYPGPGALDLTDCAPEAARALFPADRRLVIFVVDGTWDLAKGMLRRSPLLMSLPQIRFTPSTPSAYGIRHQPEAHCYSTLEAAHWLIGRLGALGVRPAPAGYEQLTACFAAMVADQKNYAASSPGARFLTRKRKAPNLPEPGSPALDFPVSGPRPGAARGFIAP